MSSSNASDDSKSNLHPNAQSNASADIKSTDATNAANSINSIEEIYELYTSSRCPVERSVLRSTLLQLIDIKCAGAFEEDLDLMLQIRREL